MFSKHSDGTSGDLLTAKDAKEYFNKECMKSGMLYFWVLVLASVPMHAKQTIEGRVAEYGAKVDERLKPLFESKGVPYPPAQLALIGLKQEGFLQVYAAGKDGTFHHIKTYPILAASGGLGPKQREGDSRFPKAFTELNCSIQTATSISPSG